MKILKKYSWIVVCFLLLTSAFTGYKLVRIQTDKGYSGINIVDKETGTSLGLTTIGELKSITPTRLVGAAFSGLVKDTNFWTETVTGSGSITQAGEILLATGTTANSTASYVTTDRSRKVTGRLNQFRAVARNVQMPTADCIRRIGAYCANDGFFFQFDGTTFGVGSRKGGIDTVVENGNLNGLAGKTIDVLDTTFLRIVIEYTSKSARFFIEGVLIHTLSATTESLTNTQDLPVSIEIINENGNTTNNSYEVLFTTILGLGQLETSPRYKYIGTNTTTICKYGSGILRRIVNLDNAGTVTIYDNTSASGSQIGVIDAAKALGTLDFNAPFSNGLTIVTALNSKITVIYE